MITIFNYKDRIKRYKDRYVQAYAEGLDRIDDWLTSGPGDQYTPNRKMLADHCKKLSGIDNWHLVNCCSHALQASIVALTNPGDKIITSCWNFIAVPQSILWVNRQIVFCDVGKDGLIDLESLAKAVDLHPDAKAVLVTHYLGRVQDCKKIRDIIPAHMKIIEDAANVFYFPSDPCEPHGWYSDVVCYSFDMSKSPASTGSGGAVASKDADLINRIREMTQQGFNRTRTDFISPATKSTMDDTTASVILEDFKICYETDVRFKRRAIHRRFEREINRPQLEGENVGAFMFVCFPEKLSPAAAKKMIRDNDVQSTSFSPLLTELDAFKHCFNVGDSYGKYISDNHLRLPCHEYLTEEQQNLIINLANES